MLLGIPVVAARPEEWLERWSQGLAQFVRQMNLAQNQMMVEFMDYELSERSQNRVRQIVGAHSQHREEVISLLGRAGIQAAEAPNAKPEVAGYSPEARLNHVLRDYAWAPDVNEVKDAWTRLQGALPADFEPGSTLVLGAGTGLLAWQIATQLGSDAPVLALDVDPLPLVVTALLLAGEEVTLTELPAHPRKSAVPCLTRSLKRPLPPASHLGLALADALDPPVTRGKWDTVVTSWFVDDVPEDAAVVPDLAASLLREGGSFICTGPFLYDSGRARPALRYCADEFIEFVERAGFEVTTARYHVESYMASPLSAEGRIEHVLYMHARKDSSKRVERPEVPPFLKPGSGASRPIPRPKGIEQAQFSPTEVAEVAALIDGERSVRQITEILVGRGILIQDGSAESGVRGCLRVIFQQLGLP